MVLAACAVLTCSADAQDPKGLWTGSAYHDWFLQQRNQLGEVCCDEADGRPIDDWSAEGHGFTVTVDGQTFHVPEKAVVLGPNRLGRAIVWTFPPAKITRADMIRCFMPGTEG
jgi:hypothetical protein